MTNRIPCNCDAVTVGGKPMPHYHDEGADITLTTNFSTAAVKNAPKQPDSHTPNNRVSQSDTPKIQPDIVPDSQATTWQDVAEYFLGDYAREHTPEECRKEAYRRSIGADSQAGDELSALFNKVDGYALEVQKNGEPYNPELYYLHEEVRAYAERLAARRAIEELKALKNHLLGNLYDDNDKSPETNAVVVGLLSKRLAVLSARLTGEADHE